MQDNYEPKPAPEWADEGWAQMQALLDQHLPVPPPRRQRFGLWWMLAAFLSGCLLTAAWYYAKPVQSGPALGQMPILTAQAANGQSTAEQTGIERSALPTEGPSGLTAQAGRRKQSPSAATASGGTPKTFPRLAPVAAEVPALSTAASPTAAGPATPKSATPSANAELKEGPLKSEPQALLPFLPGRGQGVLPGTESEAVLLEAVVPAAARQKKLQWGVEGLGFWPASALPRGFQAGLYADWQPGDSRRFTIGLSAQFQQFHDQQEERERILVFNNSFQSSSSQSSNTLLSATTAVEKMSYAALQANFSYRFHPQWSATASLQGAQLLSSLRREDWSLVGSEESSVQADGGNRTGGTYASRVIEGNDNLRGQHFAAGLGLNYHLTNRWQLKTTAYYGLTPLFEQSEKPVFRRGVSIGLAYRLR
ncbi:hypothetical protein [Phaeodactylibacter luteus]|uniref:Uncharacterized protein n=1 Tax=Phaeodactylibacter luteus TaxID=1564516 RepID=A0A5C6S7E6_9BACT|nr:hypothetical protein [Phaeodactylibacter luteus]TXB70267.1 hypothetical protein FRY97_00765 [Phaeodactylibacter luteus]